MGCGTPMTLRGRDSVPKFLPDPLCQLRGIVLWSLARLLGYATTAGRLRLTPEGRIARMTRLDCPGAL